MDHSKTGFLWLKIVKMIGKEFEAWKATFEKCQKLWYSDREEEHQNVSKVGIL